MASRLHMTVARLVREATSYEIAELVEFFELVDNPEVRDVKPAKVRAVLAEAKAAAKRKEARRGSQGR